MSLIVGAANAAGIGGGALIMPILLIFLKAEVSEAAPISNFCIFLSSLTRFILFFKRQHPERPRTLQNYEIAAVFMPLLLLGTSIGVMIGSFLPQVIALSLLVLVIAFMIYNSFLKYMQIYKQENQLKKS